MEPPNRDINPIDELALGLMLIAVLILCAVIGHALSFL